MFLVPVLLCPVLLAHKLTEIYYLNLNRSAKALQDMNINDDFKLRIFGVDAKQRPIVPTKVN